MKWIIQFLLSSIGKKLIMALTGLFLCLFLVVHMVGNLQLFVDSDGATFNAYAYHMTHSKLIKVISYGNYFFILLHAFQGIMITMYNRSVSGGGTSRYKGGNSIPTEAKIASRNMAALGLLILAFIGLHMWQFWAQMHFTEMPKDANGHKNLYVLVAAAFAQPWVVIVYLLSLVALSVHLMHGFQSAFQSLGLNHKKYTPLIKVLGKAFSILIPLGFASMPLVFFFKTL